MTIAIDCRFAAGHSGLGRYTRELALHLLKRQSGIHYRLIVRSKNESWIPSDADVIEADIAHYSFAEQTTLPTLLKNAKVDLLFSPHFNIPLLCPVPFVATIHDLILHRYPNDASFVKKLAYRVLIGRTIKKAKTLIAISDFVKSEIISEYGASLPPIHVVREGVSPHYHPATDAEKERVKHAFGLHKNFFLYVGNAKQHKNVRMLIDAFVALHDASKELILVCGGKEKKRLGMLPANVRILENVSDADLPALYSAADCFVTASLYEGYCLPVAEAMACGCPVIATDRTAIPEIARGHATLVEPTVDAFVQAMKQSHQHRASYIAGTWEKAAEETERIFL